jgi:8-oxo-dGTP pyrophosphatase MutT (NUDIX family)
MRPPPFFLDAGGEFDEHQLRIVWHDDERSADATLDALIASTWERYRAQCLRDGVQLFNGQLVRYCRHRVEDGVLIIDAGPTDYAAFIGTNYLNHARGDEFGWERFSNPIGTSATLITSDGWLVYGRRSGQVACHPGRVHAFGGGLEAGELRPDGHLDPFASLRRELGEELGLAPGDLLALSCLGLIRDPVIRQPELVFDARTALTRAEIEHNLAHGDVDAEHVGIAACPDRAEAIVPFIQATKPVPVGIGALCLHGRRLFGAGWYASALAELA